MKMLVIATVGLAGALLTVTAAETKDLPKGIEVRNYTGWDESIYLNSTETPVQVVVVPAIGGRIVHFSLNGENILFENAASQGKTMANSKDELWFGGYQCDLGPEIRVLPSHAQLFQDLYHWRPEGNFCVTVSSAPDARLGMVIEKEFLLAPDTGELGIMQRMRNESEKTTSYCLWDRTLCKGGGFAFFPLNKHSRFPAGWSLRRQANNKDYYDGDHPGADQVQVLNGVLVAETSGNVTKLGADSDAGWIAYARGKLLFVKYFPYFPRGEYSDGGNSVEVYFDQRVTELEPLSPETKLAKDQNFSFPEKWILLPLDKEVTTAEQARKLVKRIPRSPFKTK